MSIVASVFLWIIPLLAVAALAAGLVAFFVVRRNERRKREEFQRAAGPGGPTALPGKRAGKDENRRPVRRKKRAVPQGPSFLYGLCDYSAFSSSGVSLAPQLLQ